MDLAARAITAAPPPGQLSPAALRGSGQWRAAATVEHAHRRAARPSALVTPACAGRVSCSPAALTLPKRPLPQCQAPRRSERGVRALTAQQSNKA